MGVLSKLLEVVAVASCCWTGVEKAPIMETFPGVEKDTTALFCALGVRWVAQSFLIFAEILATLVAAPAE